MWNACKYQLSWNTNVPHLRSFPTLPDRDHTHLDSFPFPWMPVTDLCSKQLHGRHLSVVWSNVLVVGMIEVCTAEVSNNRKKWSWEDDIAIDTIVGPPLSVYRWWSKTDDIQGSSSQTVMHNRERVDPNMRVQVSSFPDSHNRKANASRIRQISEMHMTYQPNEREIYSL
jgi:hypothetical protein